MKVRKTKDLVKVLKKKGFELNPDINHHKFFYLCVDGKKTSVYTYISHGQSEHGDYLMSSVKKQLCFKSSKMAEDFFDCPLTKEKYILLLKDQGDIS